MTDFLVLHKCTIFTESKKGQTEMLPLCCAWSSVRCQNTGSDWQIQINWIHLQNDVQQNALLLVFIWGIYMCSCACVYHFDFPPPSPSSGHEQAMSPCLTPKSRQTAQQWDRQCCRQLFKCPHDAGDASVSTNHSPSANKKELSWQALMTVLCVSRSWWWLIGVSDKPFKCVKQTEGGVWWHPEP